MTREHEAEDAFDRLMREDEARGHIFSIENDPINTRAWQYALSALAASPLLGAFGRHEPWPAPKRIPRINHEKRRRNQMQKAARKATRKGGK